jgi:hypothetical protein
MRRRYYTVLNKNNETQEKNGFFGTGTKFDEGEED